MKKYNTLRISFAAMYFCTSFINLYLGLTNPEILRSLADCAFIGIYKYFALNSPVWLLQFSLIGFFLLQWGLVFCLLNKGLLYKLGVLGALVFHIGIIPWGSFNLINLIFLPPLLLLWRQDFRTYAFARNHAGVAK